MMYSELIDKNFVFELAKRGMVSITSSQISITVKRDGNLNGLVIPPNTHLEFLYVTPGKYDGDETATLRFVCEKRSPDPGQR